MTKNCHSFKSGELIMLTESNQYTGRMATIVDTERPRVVEDSKLITVCYVVQLQDGEIMGAKRCQLEKIPPPYETPILGDWDEIKANTTYKKPETSQ